MNKQNPLNNKDPKPKPYDFLKDSRFGNKAQNTSGNAKVQGRSTKNK